MRTVMLLLTLHFTCVSGAWAGEDYRELFNGRDLTGWEGDPNVWRVRDGILVGETKASTDIKTNTFLIWKEFDVEDFELHAVVRLKGPNSGVQYRSHGDSQGGDYCVAGYQADLHTTPNYIGMLYEERGRGILAERGEKVRIGGDGEKQREPLPSSKESIDLTQWNELEIRAVGNHLVHKLNGTVTADVVDGDAKHAAARGLLALQVSSGPPIKVEFKSVKVRRIMRKGAETK